jgi:hypothetical protein
MASSEKQTTANTSSSAGAGADTRTGEAQERAREAASEAGDAAWQQAHGQFEQQSGRAAEQGENLAAALRRMADEFEQQNQPMFSSYANSFAQYTDSFSQRLREKNLNHVMDDVRGYSRRQPALFVGGAIATGFLLARFLNSSATNNTTSTDRNKLSAERAPAETRASVPAAPGDTSPSVDSHSR